MTKRTSGTTAAPDYSIIIPEDTLARATDYLQALRVGRAQAGALLCECLRGDDLRAMSEQDLLGKLFDTKQPQIFAEMSVVGDGSDWNLKELGLLGEVSIAVHVTIFDDDAEEGDDFPGCRLFSIVAWDHVSWPGNDFFIGSRSTDDGVKAAATSCGPR